MSGSSALGRAGSHPPLQHSALGNREPAVAPARIRTVGMSAFYGQLAAVKDVTIGFESNRVHALIGPSGCGKSTFLRTLNRMHEVVGGHVTGQVLLDEENVYGAKVSLTQLRRLVGMVFQKPTPFPTMSIYHNVAAGLKVEKGLSRSGTDEVVERALRQAGLWDEVKDRLKASAVALSGGQQQRLCIARTIAPQPEVILLDEPTSSLDPQGTQRIEELLFDLKRDYTIVIVTHNMQQAARVSDTTTFFYLGNMIETGPTKQIFTAPTAERTEAYITGRFG